MSTNDTHEQAESKQEVIPTMVTMLVALVFASFSTGFFTFAFHFTGDTIALEGALMMGVTTLLLTLWLCHWVWKMSRLPVIRLDDPSVQEA